MALSLDLHSPQKWIAFRRLAALDCASRLIRRMHLGPSLALLLSYPRTQKSEPPLCAIPKHPDGRGPDDFVVFEVEETLFKVYNNGPVNDTNSRFYSRSICPFFSSKSGTLSILLIPQNLEILLPIPLSYRTPQKTFDFSSGTFKHCEIIRLAYCPFQCI
jgi:hypothetical protein